VRQESLDTDVSGFWGEAQNIVIVCVVRNAQVARADGDVVGERGFARLKKLKDGKWLKIPQYEL
jgi:hypothetical protein